MTSMATQNNPDVPGGVARVRVTASFRYSDTLIARGIDVRNWHMSDGSFNRPRVGNVAITGAPETTGLCTLDHRRSLSAQYRGMGHG